MPNKAVSKWTEVDKAWVAGLLDGEGWIGLARTSRGVRQGRYRYRAGITVSQTDPCVIDYLRTLTGTNGHRFVRDLGAPNKLNHGVSLFRKDDVVAILEAVLPFLVTKADQALDVLAFRRVVDDPSYLEADRDEAMADLWTRLREAKKAIPYGAARAVGSVDDCADAAWLAALVDGEGHIGVERQRDGSVHVLVISVVNADECLIRRIHGVVRCGNVSVRVFKVANRKPMWRWRASCGNALKVLARIGPYLIRKKPHLAVARRLDRTIHRDKNRWSPVLEHELRIREECYEAFKALNRRGRPA